MASETCGKGSFDPVKALQKNVVEYDLASMLEGFETEEEVAVRNEKLVARLNRHLRSSARPLIEKLEGCSATKRRSPEPCLSPSCFKCGRVFRQWFFDQAFKLMVQQKKSTGERGVVVSLIAADLVAASGKLATVDLKAAKTMLWKGLQKLALGYPVIGGIDVSFNEKASSFVPGHYQVHFAFAVLGHSSEKKDRKDLKNQIKSVFALEPTACRPVHVGTLYDPAEQLSYLYKTLYSRRVSIIESRTGDDNTEDLWLKGPQEAEIAAWLDLFSFQDRLLLYGLRRRGTEIVATSENDTKIKTSS